MGSKTQATVHILYIMGILAVGVWAYNIGTLVPEVRRATQPDIKEYIVNHNYGCDDIIRGGDGRMVCEVTMQAEDDELYILKGKQE